MADKAQAAKEAVKEAVPSVVKHPTPFQHVFLVDINDDGQLREVAVVKEEANGTLYYVDIMSLDNFDKGRLKKIVTNQHADKYPLWELMAQETLSNGKNGLDYFHQLVKVKHGKNHVNTSMGGGLGGVPIESSKVIGTGFSDPSSATVDGTRSAI